MAIARKSNRPLKSARIRELLRGRIESPGESNHCREAMVTVLDQYRGGERQVILEIAVAGQELRRHCYSGRRLLLAEAHIADIRSVLR